MDFVSDALAAGIPAGEFSVTDFGGGGGNEAFDKISENDSFRAYVLKVLNFFLSFVGVIATAMVIYGGYLFIVSNGDDGQKEKGQKIVLYASIGIIVILGSFALVNTILLNAGEGGQDRFGRTDPSNFDRGPGYGTIGLIFNIYRFPGFGNLFADITSDFSGPGAGTLVGARANQFAAGGVCFDPDTGEFLESRRNDPECRDFFRLDFKPGGLLQECRPGGIRFQEPPSDICRDFFLRNQELLGRCFDNEGKPVTGVDGCDHFFVNSFEGGDIEDCYESDGTPRYSDPACETYFQSNARNLRLGDCFDDQGRPQIALCPEFFLENDERLDIGCLNSQGRPDATICPELFFDKRNELGIGDCFDDQGRPDESACPDLFRRNPGSNGPGLGSVIDNPIRIGPSSVKDFNDTVVVPLDVARRSGIEVTLDVAGEASVDFGDGTSTVHDTQGGTVKTLPDRKKYGQKGSYNFQAVVETDDGLVQTFRKRIVVGGITADITGGSQKARVGDEISFSGTRSDAAVGTISRYIWRCEGGPGCFTQIMTTDDDPAESIEVSFDEPGNYEIFLKVESTLGTEINDETSVKLQVKGEKPEASFTAEPVGDPRRPALYRFDATGSFDTQGERNRGLIYQWDFAGETVDSYEPIITHEFATPGSKTVRLVVVETAGARNLSSDEVTQTLSVPTVVGLEVFVNNESVTELRETPMLIRGEVNTFEARSDQATNFEWTFVGDSGEFYTEIGPSATFVYNESDDLVPVRVRAFNDITGDENPPGSGEFTFRVRDRGQPSAFIEVEVDGELLYENQTRIFRGEAINFQDASVDGDGGTTNLRSTWKLNGRVVSGPGEIENALRRLGTYRVELIASARDNANLRDQDDFTVVVVNNPPVVNSISRSEDGRLGLKKVRVEAQATDPDPEGEIVEYIFQVVNEDIGDVILAQVRRENFAYFNLAQFPGRFEYKFRVTVKDNDGAVATSETSVEQATVLEVDNFAPEAEIYVTPSNAGTTQTIFTFIGQGTDEDGDALTYDWSFPDGPWVEEIRNYRFLDTGTYTITLTVSDGLEETTVSVPIIIEEDEEVVDPLDNTAPEAQIHSIVPSDRVAVRTPVYFYSRTNDLDGDALTYEWDLGDGTRTQVPHAIHTYLSEGTYTVTFTASDGLESVSDSRTVTVVGPDQAPTLDEDTLNFLRNKGEGGPELTEEEKEALLEELRTKSEIGTYQNFDDLDEADRDDLNNLEQSQLGSYSYYDDLTQAEKDRLNNLVNSKVGTYSDFDNLSFADQERLKTAVELGTYRDLDGLTPAEREALTNLAVTGRYKDFDNLSESEKRALENVLRQGTYQYLSDMTPAEIEALRNDLEGGTYGDLTQEEIDALITKVRGGTYGELTPEEWRILQNGALFDGREGIDIKALDNAGYVTRTGQLDLNKLGSDGYVDNLGNIHVGGLRNGGFISPQGAVNLEDLRNKGLLDGDNIPVDVLVQRGFVDQRNQLDLESLRNRALLGHGSSGIDNIYKAGGTPQYTDEAYIYTQLKPQIEERKKLCREEIAQAQTPEERTEAQELCAELELQEARVIDTLSSSDVLKLEAMLEDDPFLKRQLQERVEKIESEGEAEFEFVSIEGNPQTTFFMYGVAPDDYPRALSFVWDFGDGRKGYGQNVSVRYGKPGVYRVTFTVSDGEIEVSDFLRIHVLPSGVKRGEDKVEPTEENAL